jgi:hypothetical protein
VRHGFDEVLVAAPPVEVEAALVQAARAANAGVAAGDRLRLPLDDEVGLLARLSVEPEGGRHWLGGPPTDAVADRALLRVAWWSDLLGRRHVRVKSGPCRTGAQAPPPGSWDRLAALSRVYPDVCLDLDRGAGSSPVAQCRCGAVGPPGSLGWMGRECGACHDRRTAGEPVPDRLWSLPEAASGSLLASPDGGALVRLAPDGEVSVWDVATGARRLAFRAPARRRDWLLGASRGALRVVVGSLQPGGGFAVCDLAAGRVLLDRAGTGVIDEDRRVCFAPGGELLALIDAGRALVLRLADGRATPLYEDTPGPGPRGPQTMVLSPDERLLAVNVWDSGEALLLFELPSGRLLSRVADPYRALAFSPDGLLFCQGTGARTDGEPLAFWDMRTWTPVRRLVCPVRPPPGASLFRQPRFTPDGRAWLDLWNGRARAGDAVTNRRLGTLDWDASAVAYAALRPDGSVLTVARADGAVRVWPADLLLGSGA